MATLFRGHIVKQWSMTQPDSPSRTAAHLTQAALDFEYVTRSRPVPGVALTEWSLRPDKTPYWAALTALTLMLDSGWKPTSSLEWCGMAALFFKANRQCSLDELLERLPSSIDPLVAAGWLVAAIEEDAHFRSGRKPK